jgi:hypothetical protein
VSEKRVLRRIFGPKRDEVMGEWRKLHSGELHSLSTSRISLGRSNHGDEVGGAYDTHGRGEKVSKYQGVDGRMGTKWIWGTVAGKLWSGFTWLRIGTGGRLL